jgi:4-aminobutyrate aminotransferase-like enzyme
MSHPIEFLGEDHSNDCRRSITNGEPLAQRTFTPSQAVLARSAGVFHWTPEGRRLYDYSSGVLVANLGHNPTRWMRRFAGYMGWTPDVCDVSRVGETGADDYFDGVTLTAYNALTPLEAVAVRRLLDNVRRSPGSERLDTVMWAASGSEAVQKALWACLHRDPSRDLILATRFGFHGKKGLAGAVTGSEKDSERDPRVKFIAFPMCEIDDHAKVDAINAAGTQPATDCDFNLELYRSELERMWREYGSRLNCLITEPYLGGGGSYHPPLAYHKLLEKFCREHDILLIFDEVQANFGRTGRMYAFEAYGVTPDFVVLGKGLGNGVPVAAVVGRGDVMSSLKYGEASDTWSCNPLACASVLATLDEFEQTDVLEHTRRLTPIFFEGLERLKSTGLVSKVRGEGLVFGIEAKPVGDLTSREVAVEIVKAAYLGTGEPGELSDGIHLLGPLAGHVIRISPPMTITEEQARTSLELLYDVTAALAEKLLPARVAAGV